MSGIFFALILQHPIRYSMSISCGGGCTFVLAAGHLSSGVEDLDGRMFVRFRFLDRRKR